MDITPLFQLNLLLHMCLPYDKNSGFTPYFYNNGYKIRQIEQSIALPTNSSKVLLKFGIDKKKVTPEIVLSGNNEIILLECKVADFKLDPKHHATKQAMSYMSLSSTYLKEFFGYPSYDTIQGKILYGISNGDIKTVNKVLKKIQNELQNVLGSALPHDTFQISCESDGTYIKVNNKKIKVIDFNVTGNQHMFYIVPTDISGRIDTKSEELLKLQVKNVLRSMIGRQISQSKIEISVTSIASKINPLWVLLPNTFKQKLKLWIGNSIKNYLPEFTKINKDIFFSSNKLHIPKLTDKQKKSIIKLLTSEQFFNDSIFENYNSIQLSLDL